MLKPTEPAESCIVEAIDKLVHELGIGDCNLLALSVSMPFAISVSASIGSGAGLVNVPLGPTSYISPETS